MYSHDASIIDLDWNTQISEMVTGFVRIYPKSNHLGYFWDDPLIGFADADDYMFYELKHIISPSHMLPLECLPGAKSVIVYYIPFPKEVMESNISGQYSSAQWNFCTTDTNHLMSSLNLYLCRHLEKQGHQCTFFSPVSNYDEQDLIGDWSHKSAAYIAGLGKFGANHLLITEKGCCGRIGSIITDLELEPTPRPEQEYCLNKYNGSCMECILHCTANAFCTSGNTIFYDRHRCNEHIYSCFSLESSGFDDTCGKCSCDVPCSFSNPVRHLLQKK